MIRNDRMGDLLMSLPAVHEIRRAFPEAELTLLVQEGLRPLLEGHPDIDRLLAWDTKEGVDCGRILQWAWTVRWVWRLRRYRFDSVIIFNPTRLFHVATFLAGIPTRIGYRRKTGILLTGSLPDTKAQRNLHEVDYNLELVRLLGIRPSTPVMALPMRPEAEAEAEGLLEGCGFTSMSRPIALHPWTSNPVKAWPMEAFCAVARRLDEMGQSILIIGGLEAVPLMEQWRAEMGPDPPHRTMDLVGRTPLRVLPALLRRCAVLVSNDSGPVHVAAAVGTETVVVTPQAHAHLLGRAARALEKT
jgi:heptosyltransferase-2